MANHMTNLVSLARSRDLLSIAFTDAALEELRNLGLLVGANIEDAKAMITDSSARDRCRTVTAREEIIDLTVREDRDRHLIRFHERLCPAEAGPCLPGDVDPPGAHFGPLPEYRRISDGAE